MHGLIKRCEMSLSFVQFPLNPKETITFDALFSLHNSLVTVPTVMSIVVLRCNENKFYLF